MSSASNFNSWRRPKVNATASSQTGCSDVASVPELSSYEARAAATSPSAFVNEPHPFQLLPNLPFAQVDAHNTCKSRTGGNPTVITAFGVLLGLAYMSPKGLPRATASRWNGCATVISSAAKPCRSGELQGEGPLTSTLKLPPSFFRT